MSRNPSPRKRKLPDALSSFAVSLPSLDFSVPFIEDVPAEPEGGAENELFFAEPSAVVPEAVDEDDGDYKEMESPKAKKQKKEEAPLSLSATLKIVKADGSRQQKFVDCKSDLASTSLDHFRAAVNHVLCKSVTDPDSYSLLITSTGT